LLGKKKEKQHDERIPERKDKNHPYYRVALYFSLTRFTGIILIFISPNPQITHQLQFADFYLSSDLFFAFPTNIT
jgi:hypothetical protein